MRRESRTYNKEFKLQAVELCKNSTKKRGEIARELGIPRNTLYQWVRDFEEDGENSFRGKGVIRSSYEEMHRLKKELSDIKMERDILKKAVAIFSKVKE